MKSLKLFTLMAMLFTTPTLKAQTTDSLKKPTIVFVHGLWADGSCWNEQISALQAAGYEVIAVQNPTSSLEEDVEYTKRAIERAPGKVILVGHSWGGFVITQAGNDPKVVGLVYVAAYGPDKDETVPVLGAKFPATQLTNYLVNHAGGFITQSKEGVQKVFAQDLSPKQQGLIYATQNAANAKVFAGVSGEPAWKTKPSWYIVAKDDKTINPDLERFMAKRMNATTIELESSHVAMLAKPNEVLKMILEAAKHK